MHCFDENRVRLSGNFDTERARTLVLAFVKCDPKERSTCKSETEVEKWMKGKFVVLIENTWTFRAAKFD